MLLYVSNYFISNILFKLDNAIKAIVFGIANYLTFQLKWQYGKTVKNSEIHRQLLVTFFPSTTEAKKSKFFSKIDISVK